MSDAGTNSNQQQAHDKEESIVHSRKSVDDVWKEISRCKQEPPEMMTLEDFLAVHQHHPPPQQQDEEDEDDDVKLPLPTLSLPSLPLHSQRSEGIWSHDGGKRRAVLEPLDKAAQQRQRRMIKNRESAARSRERKQAYQTELESLALKLQEENHTLLKQKTEQARKRYNQLMENIIPVTEKLISTRYVLRKVRSMECFSIWLGCILWTKSLL